MSSFKPNKKGIEVIEAQAMAYVLELAEQVKINAKQLCPVKTGALQASIDITAIVDKTVEIGTDTGYGLAVEMGTINQPAQPFLRPALDSLAGSPNIDRNNNP